MKAKWIDFILIEQKPKTKVFAVVNKEDKSKIGIIAWYSAWRKYSFSPFKDTVFEQTCLTDISDFLKQLMNERKLQQGKR